MRSELGFTSDLPYEILNSLYESWDYSKHQNQFVDVAETLRAAMTQNPFLKVIVANGYYDLATPYFATEYTINHLGLDESLREHVALTYYEAGHMMYVHEPSLAQLNQDLAAFVRTRLYQRSSINKQASRDLTVAMPLRRARNFYHKAPKGHPKEREGFLIQRCKLAPRICLQTVGQA